MPVITGASRVIKQKAPPQVRVPIGLATAIAAMIGVTERGPIGVPTLVNSWPEFTKQFGGYLAGHELATSVQQFFVEGGTQLYVVRTVHYASVDLATLATAAKAVGVLSSAGPVDRYDVITRDFGAHGDDLSVQVLAASNGEAGEFNLHVIRDSKVLESFANLSPLAADTRSALAIVNNENTGSIYIRLSDSGGVVAPEPRPLDATLALAGGDDGLTALDDNDYLGSVVGQNGLRALDPIQDVSLVAIPGLSSSAIHNGLIAYCQTTRPLEIFTVLDPPAGKTAIQMVALVKTDNTIHNKSEEAAIYWPRVKIANPSKTVFGSSETITVPPSGSILGLIARQDTALNVYQSAAGPERGILNSVVGLETDEVLILLKRGLVYDALINPITTQPGFGIYNDGSRTLKSDANFPTITEARGAIFIGRSLNIALERLRHRPLNDRLYNEVSNLIKSFLNSQIPLGAFASDNPDEAYNLQFDRTPETVFARTLAISLGLSFTKPAEYIFLELATQVGQAA